MCTLLQNRITEIIVFPQKKIVKECGTWTTLLVCCDMQVIKGTTFVASQLHLSASPQLTVVLSRIWSTSPGSEEIPFWLYRTCAPELGLIITKLVNFSLSQHTVPRVWQTVHVIPVTKTSPIAGYGDLRSFSVKSVLSHTVEKLVVKNCLTSVLYSPLLHDQCAE